MSLKYTIVLSANSAYSLVRFELNYNKTPTILAILGLVSIIV